MTSSCPSISAYETAKKRGLDYDIRKDIYEQVQNYTLDDVVKFQQEKIKDRKYRTVILGRTSDIDLEALAKYGKVTIVPVDELFGY